MRSQFGNTEYQPTQSVDLLERLADQMVREGKTGSDGPIDDINEDDDNRGREDSWIQD